MQTEFTCGIYTVALVTTKWRLTLNNHHIAWLDQDGESLQFATIIRFSQDDLIEIAVLMNNIKRQYKQLNNISQGQVSNG
jgi:hypothetical protein